MKKIILTLLLVVAAVTTMRAQDEPTEKTAPPRITVQEFNNDYNSGCEIIIENTDEDPEAEIIYGLYGSSGDFYGWQPYYFDPIIVQGAGVYSVEAFAKAQGKLASDTVVFTFMVPRVFVNVQAYDFVVDGIYYQIKNDSTVWVSTRELVKCTNDWNYEPQAADQCYSGDVIIPSSVEYEGVSYAVTGIAAYAFEGCNLNSVYLPNSIESINQSAFDDCTGLEVITIPESVTSIDQNAFWWCSDLKRVICKAVTPPDAFWTAFWYNYDKATLFVPNEALEVYRTHQVWGRFTQIVPFIGVGPGDINGDGAISIADVSNLIDQLLSGEELPAYIDVNGNGEVTISDVSFLIDMLLGLN